MRVLSHGCEYSRTGIARRLCDGGVVYRHRCTVPASNPHAVKNEIASLPEARRQLAMTDGPMIGLCAGSSQ